MIINKEDFEKKARPVAEKIIEHALLYDAATDNITDVKVSISNNYEQENSVENSEVTETITGDSWNVSVTIYSGDKVLNFRQNTLDLDRLLEAVDNNIAIIYLVPENPDKRLLEAGKLYKGEDEDFDKYDNNPPSQEELIKYAKKMEQAAFAEKGIKTAREASISYNAGHSLTIATNGLDRLNSSTLYQASISAIAEDKDGMQVNYNYSIARHFADMKDPDEVGRKAAKDAIAKLNPTLPDSKEIPIILSKSAAASFFSSVFAAIDGTAVHRGATFLKDKLNKQVMSSEITIEDNPSIVRGMYSNTTDSTGMKSEKIIFVENGVLKAFNVSLTEARKLGIEPIGRNDGRTNSIVKPSKISKEELIKDIKEGIYIKSFLGGKVDVNNGNFSKQAHGQLIKDGKITDIAVSGFIVSGNLKEMFMNVSIADDTPKLPHHKYTFATPTTRIDGIKIAGK